MVYMPSSRYTLDRVSTTNLRRCDVSLPSPSAHAAETVHVRDAVSKQRADNSGTVLEAEHPHDRFAHLVAALPRAELGLQDTDRSISMCALRGVKELLRTPGDLLLILET